MSVASLPDMAAYTISARTSIELSKFPTDLGDALRKKELRERLEKDKERLIELQACLFAEGRRSVLLLFQALDAAGKDSCIRHVLAGVDPHGCVVHAFKAPNTVELGHDFLWRHAQAMPTKGIIGVHNRSHYEEVLVVRVHPEYLLSRGLPGVHSAKDLTQAFWERRFKAIRAFERHLADEGVVLMKFYLHMSKEAQKRRFLERIEDPSKHWRFNARDVEERAHWEQYREAYQQAIGATAEPHAPWYIIPADDQWESRAIVGRLVRDRLESMAIGLPARTQEQALALEHAREKLLAEKSASRAGEGAHTT
jgi:PPK2 family polyphosphate:nucleotide phosphotransferase